MPRYTIKVGEYTRRERQSNGSFARVTRMGLGTCTDRTFLHMGDAFGVPTAAELEGATYTNANGLDITYTRSGSVHGKTVIAISNATTVLNPGDPKNYHFQIPDDMPIRAVVAHLSGDPNLPADITGIRLECGKTFPLSQAAPAP